MEKMRYTPGWVSDEFATLEKMVSKCRLWVAEQKPSIHNKKLDVWEIDAEPTDTATTVLKKFAAAGKLQLPNGSQERQAYFHQAVGYNNRTVLIVNNAERWVKARAGAPLILKMRYYSEEIAPVILIGDVAKIAVAASGNNSFMGNALFCVRVQMLFG